MTQERWKVAAFAFFKKKLKTGHKNIGLVVVFGMRAANGDSTITTGLRVIA